MPYPRGLEDRLDALERRVEQLFASIQNRAPTTEASAGWVFTDMATPSTPPAGKTRIYSQSGRFWAVSTAGAVPLLLPDYPQADFVAAPASVQAPVALGTSAPSSMANALRDDVIEVHSKLSTLIANLKGSSPSIVSPF